MTAKLKRVIELIDCVREHWKARGQCDHFFRNFEEDVKTIPEKRASFLVYERAFEFLDTDSWTELKAKAVSHFMDERGGRKQGFFDQLADAFAYRYLIHKGASRVRILPEGVVTQPDIAYCLHGVDSVCEVKSINISDLEIERRCSGNAFSCAYRVLNPGFLNKLGDHLSRAQVQIAATQLPGMVYLIVHFDDIALDYYRDYRKELRQFLDSRPEQEIVVKVNLRGRRMMHHRVART